jgi:uncharacterized protein
MGSALAALHLEEYAAFYEGADPQVLDLWKWHLAEEFEHRTVAYDMYMALFGDNFWDRYIYRLYGFFYAAGHIHSNVVRLTEYLLEKDREGMTPAQIAQSKARLREFHRRQFRASLRGMFAVLSPFYNPARKQAPRELEALLKRFEPQDAAAAT